MQPENIQPSFGPEQPLPNEVTKSSERSLDQIPSPETGLHTNAERREQVADAQAAVVDAAVPLQVADPVDPVTQDTSAATPSTVTGPAIADDADVIEKEWVDKAKDIISKTKDDPYQRGAQVTQLQKDYQKKRYGRELGTA